MIFGKKLKGMLTRLVVFALLICLLPINAYADRFVPVEDADAEIIHPENPPVSGEEPKVGEVVDERTETTKTFYNGNGLYTKHVYFEPIHRKKDDKKMFEEISSDLTDDDTDHVETENTDLETKFLKKMQNGHYADFISGEHTVSFSVLQASGLHKPSVPAKDVSAKFVKKSNQIDHKHIFPQIDLRNLTFNQNIKEDIILHRYEGYHQFTFKIDTDLTAIQNEDGSISLVDDKKKEVFNLPAPSMSDSTIDEKSGESVSSNNVLYELEKVQGGYKLVLDADPNWLADPVRKYPVYIDPTTSVSITTDTFVMSAYPTTNYSSSSSKWDEGLNQYILKAGYYDSTTGTSHALLMNPIANINGLNVTSATLNTYVAHHYYANSPNGLWVNRNDASFSPAAVTWNTKPGSTNIGKVDVGRGQWARFDVTSTVKGWVDGTRGNYGFTLHTNGNGQTFWKKITSSANATNKPYLSVTYSIPTPEAPVSYAYTTADGTGYVDLSWEQVRGASSYTVWIYNGKSYEAFDVGNVTSWSTKNKKIWPTATGRYLLHHDGKGSELPVDPSQVYKNSGGSYPNTTHYWFRISATYPLGESAMSGAATPSILGLPSAPTGQSYPNVSSSQSGYVNLNWSEVKGATGYLVWVFNGKSYEAYDVGDTDSWTTQNKGIWPTQAELDTGRKTLHHPTNPSDTNYGGTELPITPWKLYAKNGTTYATSPYYYFRVSAYNDEAETIYSPTPLKTQITSVPFLGTEDYWSFVDVPGGSVNTATGNLILSEGDFSLSGKGPDLLIDRTYNSYSTIKGLFGEGWHSNLDSSLKLVGTEAKYIDEDGTMHIFQKQADGTYKPPTGVYLELTEDANSLILTSTDQSKVHYSKTSGMVSSIKDGYGNTLTYSYDSNGKLKTLIDASGRTFTLEYNQDGYVSRVTGLEDRQVSYGYTDGFLTKVTQTAGEITSYEYDDGKLTKVYEPNHTVEKPVVSQYVYDSERLVEAINPKNQTVALTFDVPNNTLVYTNPNGKKDQYKWNDAANPIEVIQDVGGLNITSTSKYEGNHLIESKDPNDQGSATPTESYTYDSNGNVLTSKDSYGTETYQYNTNNDVTSVVDTEGDQTTIAYDHLDAVSETDQVGKMSSIATYQKDGDGNSNGNLLESSYALSTATNLLLNNSFETDLTNWTKLQTNDSGSLAIDSTTTNSLSGSKSIKISTQATSAAANSYIAATQDVVAEANKTYSVSGLMKTNLSKANAFFQVQFLNASNATISWADNRYSQLSGSRTWTERQLSFKTPANTAKIRLYLMVDHSDASASGSAWFDMIQFEKSDVSSSYNPVINSSFIGSLTGWTGTGGSLDTTNGFENQSSLKVVRTSDTQAASEYKQTVTIGQNENDQPFDMTLTGLSNASNVVKSETVSERDYAIVGQVTYTDGSTKEYIANFPVGTQEWNRAAIKIPATKPVSKIDILTVFKGNYTGTVWFDGIRLLKGSVITKNKYDDDQNYVIETEDESGYVSSSTFDKYGNTTSETDAKGETKAYQYDLANQLQNLLLANGTSIRYTYDLNGNMTSKTISDYQGKQQTFSYLYDEDDKLLESVGPLQDKTSNEYDANGNLIKTTLPNGNTITNVYDGTDRVQSVAYNDVPTFSYTYDKNGNEKSVTYEKDNRSKTKVYDSSNRITKQDDRGATQEWKYPSTSDKLNEFIVTNGYFTQHLTYHYNELDLNTVVNDGELNYRFDYDERGNAKTFTTGNGAGASFKYDDRGLVQQLVVGLKDGTDLIDETYRYDENGNRTKITTPNGQSISYEYGKLDQLEKETLKDGTILEYSYDGFGNRTAVKETKNGLTNTINSEYNLANQLTKYGSESNEYDLNGNRIEDGKYEYKWNSQDQLESITKKGESTPFVSYKYDDDGRRIQKTVGTTLTNYHYDGDSLNVLYETNGQDQVVKSYIYSETGQLLAMKKGTAKYFYHFNAHGDVISLTDVSGNIVASYEYDAWGNPLKVEESAEVKDNPYRYAGYQYDHETGMYYLIARYYQPNHGVFLSLDPDPGDDDDILTQNGYTYANNNPVMMVDPDGHYVWLAINAGFAAYDGYKAYKSGKGAKGIAKAAAKGAVGGGKLKIAKAALRSAKSAAQFSKLKTHYRLAQKYGTARTRQLNDGRIRYYSHVKPAKKKGEMAGRRLVREWNPHNGKQRTWHETVDYKGRIRQVRPQINGQGKTHYMFDKKGSYTGKW